MLIAEFRNIENVKDFQENYLDEPSKKGGLMIDGVNLFCVHDSKYLIGCLNKYREDKKGNWKKEWVDFVVLELYAHELDIEQTSIKKLSFNGTTIES